MSDDFGASVETSASQPLRERVGLVTGGSNAATLVKTIVAAEAAGVRQIWSTQGRDPMDTLTVFAVAASQTSSIRLGTSIVPTYPRHPLTMVGQALAINDLAPGRLRLGIGPSHRPTMEGGYGFSMVKPLDHLREYVEIVRAALWEGSVDHQGHFFTVKATLPRTAKVPILISALRENAFRLAGEISDGALPWLCPISYLLKTALPAMRQSAQNSGRPVPPLIAHVLVAVSEDRQAVLNTTRAQVRGYGHLPFYANMFAAAGFPVFPDGSMSDELISSLVISGSETEIADRLSETLAAGLDELLVLPVAVHDGGRELTQLMQLIGHL
jgi:F420-dependent oxidoreductase-like protein